MQLRRPTAEDIPALARLWHEGWHSAHPAVVPSDLTRLRTLDSFSDRARAHLAQIWLAEDHAHLLGFFMLHEDELDQFYMSASARGTGAAQDMIAAAESELINTGHTRAWLACSVGNDRAARFYEKSGWRRVATQVLAFETSAGPFPLEIWRYEKDLCA